MRAYTAGENTVLTGSAYDVYWYAEVKNGSGTWKDLSALSGGSYCEAVTIEEDIDQPCGLCTLELRRDGSSTLSLSPLRTDSTLNVNDAAAYSPLLDVGREIRVWVATVTHGTAPISSDYKKKFHGYIDEIADNDSPIVVKARDLGGKLVDTWLTSEATYGDGVKSAETVIQDILTASGVGVTLYTPVATGYVPPARKVDIGSVFDAIRAIAEEAGGYDLRYRFRASSGNYELTLSLPNRTASSADYTWSPSKYIDVRTHNLNGAEIRNSIRLTYGTASPRASVTVNDAVSVSRWGTRFLEIVDQTISSSSTASTIANAVLSDLKNPKAETAIETLADWRFELGDVLDFAANSVHFNTTQQRSVTGWRLELRVDHHRLTLNARGTPCGQYLLWLRRGTEAVDEPTSLPPSAWVGFVSGTATSVTVSYTGTLAPGALGPISMTRRIDVGDTADSWIAPGTSIGNETITRDKKLEKVVTLQVTDTSTGLVAYHSYVVGPELTALDRTTGKINPSVPDTGGDYIPRGDSNRRIKNQSVLQMLSVGNLNSYMGATISASDAGTSATITIPAHTFYYGTSLSTSYASGSLTGMGYEMTYYVFGDDPTFNGTTGYSASTAVTDLFSVDGRRYLGKVTTPAAAGSPTTGTPGSGSGRL